MRKIYTWDVTFLHQNPNHQCPTETIERFVATDFKSLCKAIEDRTVSKVIQGGIFTVPDSELKLPGAN